MTSPADGQPLGAPPLVVRYRRVDATPHTLRVSVLGDADPTGLHLPARLVSADGGAPLLQKWVPPAPSGEPGRLDPLDREIQATHRFALLFPGEGYPPELPRLRYYDVDSDIPSALFEPPRGAPARTVLPQLGAQDRYRLQTGLLRALYLTGTAGMTHGRVDLDTLRWDAATRTVQLVGFEHAARAGERGRRPGGEPADIRDDMWDAGLAIWRSAYPSHSGSGAPDLTVDGGALSTLLAGVFVDSAAARPSPGDLLARLREPARLQVTDLGGALRPSLSAFDTAVRRKRERRREDARAAPAPSRWSRFRTALSSSRPPATPPAPALVRCPVCLDSYPRPDAELWHRGEGEYYRDPKAEPDATTERDPLKQSLGLLSGYRRCPNPSRDAPEHYLPANYFAYDPPLVVALVGRPAAGKTHLLAAMVRETVERGGLTPYGITATPLDLHRHDVYRRTVLEPTEHGVALPTTPERLTDPAEILLLRGRRTTRPLVFFDVAGEDLRAVDDGRLGRFLIGAGALIFVHGLDPTPDRGGNQALEMSLARLRAVPDLERLPAAIVATKSDRLRYHPPVHHWLRRDRGPLAFVDAEAMHWESRDVFAFLHHRGEHAALAPFSVFDRCTLHFVSASGSEVSPDKEVFPRGFEPSRVLEPLVAILAMAGMIEGPGTHLAGS